MIRPRRRRRSRRARTPSLPTVGRSTARWCRRSSRRSALVGLFHESSPLRPATCARVSRQERDAALSAGCRGCGDSPRRTTNGRGGPSWPGTGTYGMPSGYLRWCRHPLHPFVHTSPHVFNRAGWSLPALCCIQYKALRHNPLTADWRGNTSAANMRARGAPPVHSAGSRTSFPSRPSPSDIRGRIVSVSYLGRSC